MPASPALPPGQWPLKMPAVSTFCSEAAEEKAVRTGYLGVGSMGGAIASALAKEHEVFVFDLSPRAVEACVAAGAVPYGSLADLTRESRTIFLCLPTFAHVLQVLDSRSELISAATEGTTIVDQSTSHPLTL